MHSIVDGMDAASLGETPMPWTITSTVSTMTTVPPSSGFLTGDVPIHGLLRHSVGEVKHPHDRDAIRTINVLRRYPGHGF